MDTRIVAAILAMALPAGLVAQSQNQTQQRTRPPIAVYWMSVETAGGMGMEIPPGMGGFMPPGMAGGKRVKLELGSSQTPSGDPRASHAIPPGLAMGSSLPLVTPRTERAQGRERDDDEPEFERPQGRMLIYWGCGERVRAGQPVVFDFARMNPQEAARVFRSVSVSRPRGPATGRNRTYGTWPNAQDGRAVPSQASLRGDHAVTGNYSPDIRFAVDRHDFMESVAFDPINKTRAGAYAVKWKTVPTATGYFATAMGQGDSQNDFVMWSSSEVQVMGQVLMDYLAPAEVARLIRDRVVLAPQTNECQVPAGIFRGDGSMFNFIAYGDELNLVQPGPPRDPRQVWEQTWAMKLRLKSTAMALLSDGDGRDARRSPRGREREREQAQEERAEDRRRERAQEQSPQREPAPQQARPAPADPVQEGVRALRGIFGF